MRINKKILLYFLVVSQVYAAKNIDIRLKSSLDFNTEFTQKDENKKENQTFKTFAYDKSGYNLSLVDLDFRLKKIDLNLGTVIKSKRADIQLNDWDNEEDKKKAKNHDFMSKIYLKYNSPEFYGLKSETKLTYYVDDFVNDRKKNKVEEKIEDLGKPGEYIEADGTKQALGNILFDSTLKGKIKESEIDLGIKYKANQIVRFDKDEAYIKGRAKLKQKINKDIFLDMEYIGFYDLNLASKKFDTFDKKMFDYPDAGLPGHYVHHLDHDTKFNIKYMFDKGEFNVNNSLNVLQLLSAGERKNEKIEKKYSVLKPKTDFNFKLNLNKNLSFIPKYISEFEYKREINYKQDQDSSDVIEEKWAYKPAVQMGLKYIDEKISNEFAVGYKTAINVKKYFSKSENIAHEIYLANKGKININIMPKLKFKLEDDLSLALKIKDKKLLPNSDKIAINTNLEYEANDKLKIISSLKNDFNMTTKKKVLNPDDYENNFETKLEVLYTPLKDILKVNTEMYFNNNSSFIYFPYAKDMSDPEEKLIYLGDIRPISIFNKIGLKTKIEHQKKFNANLSLNSGLGMEANFQALAITKEKLYHFENKDIPSNKKAPEISDYRQYRYNLGGEIKVNPFVEVKYSPIEKLDLNTKLEVELNFAKEVVNIIKNDKRPDNGQYSYIDKNFGFKKLSPKIAFELKYRW